MNVLGIFAKQPIAGSVKTRLARTIGDDAAARVYESFVSDLASRLGRAADRRLIGYAPANDAARQWFHALSDGRFSLWQQPETDLGTRMNEFFDTCFESGATRSVLIGSDTPNLPVAIIEEAFSHLESADIVLGPAVDGGYYLVGQSERSHPIFDGIEWSSRCVFSQTLSAIKARKLKFALLPPWYDVDTIDELRLLHSHLEASALAGQGTCSRTQAVLASIPHLANPS